MTYFSILGFLNISGISKATNYPKVVNGDDGNLRAELQSWSRVGPHSWRGLGKGGSGALLTRIEELESISQIWIKWQSGLENVGFQDLLA